MENTKNAEELQRERIAANLELLRNINTQPKSTEEQRTEARKKIDEFNKTEYLKNNYISL